MFVEAKGAAKRGTFIIDKQGILRWSVVTGIDDSRDADEYFKVLEGLRSAA